MEDDSNSEKEHQDKQQNNQKVVRILATVVLVFTVGFLIYYKISINPEFSPRILTILVSSIVGFYLILFFGFKMFQLFEDRWVSKNKKENKLPAQISIEEAREYAKKILMKKDYADMIKHIKKEITVSSGDGTKNQIYACEAEGVYAVGVNYVILINMNYPEKKYAVLKDPTPHEVLKTTRGLPMESSETPNTTIIEENDAFRGTTRKTTKIEKPKKEEDKSKEPTL